MILKGVEAERITRAIPTYLAGLLVHGPDEGQVRETARTIARLVAPDLNDTFQVVEVTGAQAADDPAHILDSLLTPSLLGGRRLVWVRDAGDKLTAGLKQVPADPHNGFLLVQAGDLPKTSSLRKLFESERHLAALPCYADDSRGIATVMQQELAGYTVAPDARTALLEALGSDRALVRGELDKLKLYVGQSKAVTLADVQAVCLRVKVPELDHLCLSLFEGQLAPALQTWDMLAREGTSPIAVLRILQNMTLRLLTARANVENGTALALAIRQLKPPVFFKVENRFARIAETWSVNQLERVLARLVNLEQSLKTDSQGAAALFQQALLGLCKIKKKHS